MDAYTHARTSGGVDVPKKWFGWGQKGTENQARNFTDDLYEKKNT
jgi:hypothetical protein